MMNKVKGNHIHLIVIAVIIICLFLVFPCGFLEHNYIPGKITREATCGKSGERLLICERCGKNDTDYISETGDHVWSEWTVVEEATYDSGGKEERSCEVCGEYRVEYTDKIPIPDSFYKDQELFNVAGKAMYKVYCDDGTISFEGTFDGYGNFIVQVLDSNQELQELVCNEIGTYYLDKTVYVGPGWHYIQVECSRGTWDLKWYGTRGN